MQIYEKIDSWHQFPPTETIAESADIDLDGYDELLLYNQYLFAIFESMGGKISVFSRSESSNKIYQTLGNFVSYSGSETEFEGITNDGDANYFSYRTSGLKDWYVLSASTNTCLCK